MTALVYCAPIDRPMTVLHVAEDGAAFDEPRGAEPLTRCGLIMRDDEHWIAVRLREGDRVCLGCLGIGRPGHELAQGVLEGV
jgi:hypothetical protein